MPGSSTELIIGKVGNSVTEKVGGGSDTGGRLSPLTIGSVGKGANSGVVGKGRTLLMEGSDNSGFGIALMMGFVGKGPISGAVGKARTLLIEGSDNGGIGIALMIGSVGKGPIVGSVGKGRTLIIEEGAKVGIGSSVSVGSASIGLAVAGGSKRPSERRKQMRSLQPNGRLVAAVGPGGFRRLSERTTQSRESHVRGSVEGVETGKMADGDGVVLIASVVRGFKAPEIPGPLRLELKVQSGSQSGQRFGREETAGGGGNQCGEGNQGGGGCHGLLGLRGGSGAGTIHGLLGFKGGSGGGGIQGL